MSAPHVTITLEDGTTADVSLDSVKLPEGYTVNRPDAPAEGYTTMQHLQSEVARRSADNKSIREQLRSDKTFHSEILRSYGVELGADGKPVTKSGSVDVTAIRQQWERDELEPLQGKIAEMQRVSLSHSIVEAARAAGVDERFLKPVAEGSDPLAVSLFKPFIKEDEGGTVYVQNGNVPFLNDGTGQGTYAPLGDAIKRLIKSNAAFTPYLKSEPPQGGSGYNGSDGGSPTKIIGSTAEEKVRLAKEMGRDAFNAQLEKERRAKLAAV